MLVVYITIFFKISQVLYSQIRSSTLFRRHALQSKPCRKIVGLSCRNWGAYCYPFYPRVRFGFVPRKGGLDLFSTRRPHCDTSRPDDLREGISPKSGPSPPQPQRGQELEGANAGSSVGLTMRTCRSATTAGQVDKSAANVAMDPSGILGHEWSPRNSSEH